MPDNRPQDSHRPLSLPVLLVTIGGYFIAGSVSPIVQGQYIPIRAIVSATTGFVLFAVAFTWHKFQPKPSSLRAQFERIAGNAWTWICLVGFVGLWLVVGNALEEIRHNNEIVALRNDELSMARVLDRAVLPRHLTKQQESTISGFLLQFNPHEYAFQLPLRDEEASAYSADIDQALLKGGWTRSATNPYDYKDDTPQGLTLNFIQTQEHMRAPEDSKNPKQEQLLEMALGLAGVRLDGMGGGSGPNITADRLVIAIGRRRMDSYKLTPPDGLP